METEVKVSRQVFERYWREANAARLALLVPDEVKVLVGLHWGLLLGARLDEETDKLLGAKRDG